MITHRERAPRDAAVKGTKKPSPRAPARARQRGAAVLLVAGLVLAAAWLAAALASTAALAPKPKVPVVVPPMPHVDICHPNVCYLTQKGQDEYACDHACQWDAPLDAQNDTVINFELKFLKRPDIENDVPYMYLDSKGNVTVGIGHLVANKAAAELLPFYNATTGKRATKAEIDAAFDAVKAAPKHHRWTFYKPFSNLVLHESDIEAMALQQLNEATAELKIMFPDYENYPAKARAALLDMMYNLGAYKLSTLFPIFDQAIRVYNFDMAATQSHRTGIQQIRNDTIFDWLTDAANWEVSALAKKALCGVQPPEAPPSSGPPILPAAAPASAKPAAGTSGGG